MKTKHFDTCHTITVRNFYLFVCLCVRPTVLVHGDRIRFGLKNDFIFVDPRLGNKDRLLKEGVEDALDTNLRKYTIHITYM